MPSRAEEFLSPLVFDCAFFLVHSVEKREICSHLKNYFVKTTLVKSVLKKLISQYLCEKMVRVDFRNFHTLQCWYNVNGLQRRLCMSVAFLANVWSLKNLSFWQGHTCKGFFLDSISSCFITSIKNSVDFNLWTTEQKIIPKTDCFVDLPSFPDP